MLSVDDGFGQRFYELITLQNHNTRVALMATALLGATAAVVGVFMVLRRQALIGDVVGHSALPGIGMAFLLLEMLSPGSGKSVPWLLTGAFFAGLLGAGCVLLIDRYSRIRADAALAIVLSIFYGAGAVLLNITQKLPGASSAGLKNYVSGKTASLVMSDVWLFAALAGLTLLFTLVLFKEWVLLCFDDQFAAAQGRPVLWLDVLLVTLVAAVSIIGMQSVGLILVVALLIIPASAARFWTDDIRRMALIAAIMGACSGLLGVAFSSVVPKAAAGPTIVLAGACAFLFSLVFGRRRGLLWRSIEHRKLRWQIGRQDLLRACYEVAEGLESGEQRVESERAISTALQAVDITEAALQEQQTWNAVSLNKLIADAVQSGLIERVEGRDAVRLTSQGVTESARLAHQHRLWELYMIHYAAIAADHVHRSADAIEHVLDTDTVQELERLLATEQ